MHDDLVPVQRAQELLGRRRSSEEIVEELRLMFGLDMTAATAAAAAAFLLVERGVMLPRDEFVRPYV
jgi:hypothetical protein